MNAEAKKPIDLSVLSWAEAATGSPLLEYLFGGNVEALRSGKTSPTDQQAEIIAALSTLRQQIPKELEEANVHDVLQGWLTQIGTGGKSVARSIHELATGTEEPIPARNDAEAALAVLALDSYPAFLLPPDPLPFPVMLRIEDPSHHVASLLFNHPQARTFTEAALRDPVLKKVFEEGNEVVGQIAMVYSSTGSGGQMQLSMLPNMVLSAAWRRMPSGTATPSGFVAAAQDQLALVRDVLDGKERRVTVRQAYTGILLPADARFEVPCGVVRQLTDRERQLAPESLKGQVSGSDSSGQSTTVNYDGEVLLEHELPYRARIERHVEDTQDWPQDMRSVTSLEQISVRLRFSLLLAVERESRVQLVPTWRTYDDPLSTGRSMSWSDPRQGPAFMPTQLTQEEVKAWSEWYGHLNTAHVERIELAINRILRAIAERREPSDVLIDSVIAWENLFGSSQGEPTLRVTACLARLLEESPAERKALRSNLTKIYSLRSKIVHGSKVLEVSDYARCQEALEVAIRAVRVLTTTRTDILQLANGTTRSEALLLEA